MKLHRWDWLVLLVLLAATAGLYWQSVHFDSVHYDDPEYVFKNDHVPKGITAENIRYAFTSRALSHWHPLTWLSLMLDAQLFGVEPGVFHRTNVLLHTASTMLLFLILRTMTGSTWRSALVTGLFALHPLRVESVAWISERKDVLSMFLGMASLLAYVVYAKHAEQPRRGTMFLYALTIALFALSLLAKSMLVTLPAVMLLIDYWPLRRLRAGNVRRAVVEKLPLLALSAASAAMTLFTATRTGAVHGLEQVALWPRIANAITAHVEYLFDMIWPVNLVVLYPFLQHQPLQEVIVSAALLAIVTFVAMAWLRQWPHVAVGWFWFLIVLMPVNGIINIGELARADRYTYFPMIGILVAVVWSIPELKSRGARALAGAAAVVVLVVLSLATTRQLQHWRNTQALFDHTLSVIGPHATIEMNYGAALAERGDHEGAAKRYLNALRLRPGWGLAIANVATQMSAAGQYEQAVYYYHQALRAEPRQPMIWFNLGIALMRLERWAEAEQAFQQTLQFRPNFDPARQNLLYSRQQQGK